MRDGGWSEGGVAPMVNWGKITQESKETDMGKMTSVALDDHMADFVADQVDAGEFGSEADVIHAGLQLLEERSVKLAELRALIDAGDASGVAENFDFDAWLAKKKVDFNA